MRTESRRRAGGAATLGLVALWLTACGKGTEIVRAPLVSPVVVPAPDVFRMNVAVKNYSETETSQNLWLRVYTEYWNKANPAQFEPPCTYTGYLHVGALAPGQSWGQSDFQIDQNSGCRCVKDACPGHLWLSLHLAPGYGPHIDGPNTALHVTWAADGDLAKLTVSEF